MGNRCPREARCRGRAPDLRPFRVSDVVQTIGEEWKVTAEDNMRRETNHWRGLLLFEQIQSAAIKPIVAKTFPLAKAADALRYLVEGRPFGRVVLTI
jgi:NADPH:quinone reductase-like Zn-dependent oxidoreductase